jgi:hypothetical protein
MSLQSQLLSSYTIDVLEMFSALEEAMQGLKRQIIEQDAALPVWFSPPPKMPLFSPSSDREKICAYLYQFDYLNEQDPKEILVGPGIVAASLETLQAIEKVNQAKQGFKKAMLALKKAYGSLRQVPGFQKAMEVLLNKRQSGVAGNLRRLGLSRLHLKQCYRLIPCFYEKPEKIAWTWANTRAIRRISVVEADALLCKQGEDGRIAWQREKLGHLAQDEPLAIVQDLAPHLRANIVFKDPITGATRRKMIKGPVPFFYAEPDISAPGALPRFTPPGEKKAKDKERPTRKDVKIDPIVFLPAIRAHRYA